MTSSKCRSIIHMIVDGISSARNQSECELCFVRVDEGEQKVVVSDVMSIVVAIRPFHAIVASEHVAVF